MEVLHVRMVAVVWISSTSSAANAPLVTLAQNARQVGHFNNTIIIIMISFTPISQCVSCQWMDEEARRLRQR